MELLEKLSNSLLKNIFLPHQNKEVKYIFGI